MPFWKTKHKYEETFLIKFSEKGISFEQLEEIDPVRGAEIAHHFLMEIISSLGRLVGKQLANKLVNRT